MDLYESIHWLQEEAESLIRASKRVMQDGTTAFPPQVGSHYEAFWLRDYEYLLEGAIDVFTDEQLHDACMLFSNSLAEDGSGVDCILFDGKPIYRPGYGTMGENPVTDGGPFTVGVAWHSYQRTGNRSLLERIIDDLVRTLEAVPLYGSEPLVYIDPDREWDRCPYGFTDQIRKTGCLLFSSLLYATACSQLADLLTAVGREEEARAWSQTSAESKRCINTTFWDEEMGLYRAATISCREHDIWGSAFAVYSGSATGNQAVRIAEYLQKHYEGLILHGQLRHLPEGTYWQKGGKKDVYQNGGYWATPIGWFVFCLDLVAPQLADATIIDLVSYFQQTGVFEWISETEHAVAGYLASVALPLSGIRKMLARRERLKESGTL